MTARNWRDFLSATVCFIALFALFYAGVMEPVMRNISIKSVER